MVGEMSICPINWDDYYENAEKALDIIWSFYERDMRTMR